jgi:hypothetical protein
MKLSDEYITSICKDLRYVGKLYVCNIDSTIMHSVSTNTYRAVN